MRFYPGNAEAARPFEHRKKHDAPIAFLALFPLGLLPDQKHVAEQTLSVPRILRIAFSRADSMLIGTTTRWI